MRKKRSGFTLIELMILTAIVGIVLVMAIGSITKKYPPPDTQIATPVEFGQGVYFFNTRYIPREIEGAALGKGLVELLRKNPNSKISLISPLICSGGSCGYWVTLEPKEVK